MKLASSAALLLLTAVLAGCVVEDGDGEGPQGDAQGDQPFGYDGSEDVPAGDAPVEGQAPSGAGAGTQAQHGKPARDDGDVTVTPELLSIPPSFTARQTITITNDFAGASEARVSLSTGAGGVEAKGWTTASYQTVVVLEVRAGTEDQARAELARMTVSHDDHLEGGTLVLATAVTSPRDQAQGVSYSGTVTASLPQPPAYALRLGAGSGFARTEGLGGPSAVADTGSGDVSVDGVFGVMAADTGSGHITLAGKADTVVADTGSGGVTATLGATRSGSWSFEAGSGSVDVTVRRAGGVEVDVVADNGSGSIHVDIGDGRAVGEQDDDHRHVRSAHYDGAAIQTSVEVTTGSGDIDVGDE